MNEPFLIGFFVFVFGAVIGSFLNVCIVRLPLEQSIVTPSSHCVHCKRPLSWYDNIPFFSYLLLRGRCRFCHERISLRYFLVELTTAVSFWFFYRQYGLTPLFFAYLFMLAGFIIATFVDLEHRIIPDEVSVGGMFAGLILSLLVPKLHVYHPTGLTAHFKSLGLSALGALIGGGSIYLMGLLGDFIFKKESMGGGDVKLMAMVGAFLGWKIALMAFFIAPFFGAVYGIAEKIRTKDSTIAYGPFLVMGTLISMFYGNKILNWLTGHYQYYNPGPGF
jgi:leader peptidase (prepilin peptidase) / N-methyltransferase